jgi:phenylalanyl-tRNA synthetase alpha subunit
MMIGPGFMRVFFKKMGIEKVRFKPAYNPYTEVRPTFSQVFSL